ncbi:uncharacterized protein 2mit [Drosophila kikkawai]|uniref:Uncharacterized protein 2mit n=1 Tax=Drosophila kikkawai TaxID=30033 RepID=A0A6P4HX40_DROKI|nr:uncharacterized protein LOC108073233 [Drosophila kikkawai]XP_017020271.1 uncharacterized protein LOC108073233 [Drosophila kikkawai]XP_041630821.1 uncharacterized protein LOC108073233 [Drosophila kikkawai]
MVKIVNQHCDLGLALLLAWTLLTRLVVVGGNAQLVDLPMPISSSRSAAEWEEQQLSQQDVGLSYPSIHRMLRDENEPASFRGELRYQQKRHKRDLGLNAPANKLNLTHRDLRAFNSSGGQWKGDLQAITAMDLSDNQLSSLSLDKFKQLWQLDVSNNSLSVIPLSLADSSSSLPLVTLDLSCNRFRQLSTNFFVQRLPQLKNLNLAHNQLLNISRESFYNLLELQTLILSHNNISDIDYETFLALPNLQHLDLSHNRLSGSAIRALQGIPDLVSLSIAYNPEVGVAMQEFVASWSLKELDASGTGLCQVPAALAQSVRTLKLSDNWLKAINCGDMDSYPLLQYLDLSHSRIAQVEDDALGRLELLTSLFLDHNLLMRVPSSLPPSLEHLFLQHNQIMELPPQAFVGLVNLQTLDLSGNRLIFLPALSMPKLLTLNLQSSGVESVSQSIVHTLPQLRDLLLEDNPIKCSDLLAIAEWASPCRAVDVTQSRGDGGQRDLKAEYLQFHDFYENFSGSKCGERKLENDTRPPSCSVSRATETPAATTTQRTMPKVKKSKGADPTATSATATPATSAEPATTATSPAPTAMQSVGNSVSPLTTKTLRPAETTSLEQRRQQQVPGMLAQNTTTGPAESLPSLVQTGATTTDPILAMPAATATAATATTGINSSQPANISGATKTTAASVVATATTAIEVPQTILASKKSDKMPADKAQGTLLKYPTSDTSGQVATATPIPTHKHATLQLHVKDRHLIGTPLLMHKGDVLLVDAEHLLLPGTATVADANANSVADADTTVLDSSQQQNLQTEPEKRQSAADKRLAEAINGDTKAPAKSHKKKPSLSIKKMTYSTKHAVKAASVAVAATDTVEHSTLATSVKPQHQHSSVNTPREASLEELSTFAQLKAYVELKSESKPEHLMDQREESQHNLTGNHPGVMLLVACILFVVLMAGLAHVYRCELPWQRGNRSGHLRPHHQRHLGDTDDVHSFLHYQGSLNSTGDPARLHKWHHSTRREAPYSSPLHNLQARELQQQQRCQQFYCASLADKCSSAGSTTSGSSSSRSSLHSPSRDDSYYIEMAPSSPPAAMPSLPMELLGGRSTVNGSARRADRMAATDLGGTTAEAASSTAVGIKSVSSRLMAPSSRRLGLW